jgi:hypothetical protein
MSFTTIRSGRRAKVALALGGALAAVVAVVGSGSISPASGGAAALGQAPPEWAANAGACRHQLVPRNRRRHAARRRRRTAFDKNPHFQLIAYSLS